MEATELHEDISGGGAGSRFEETKRIGRVLRIVQLIHLRPRRFLRRDLAEFFEVSQRQIDKDLELVRHALVLPLRHTSAGYYFEEVPQLPAVSLAFGEALALLLAAQTANQVPGVDDGELDSAIARLEAGFPAPLRQLLRQRRAASGDWRSNRHRAAMLRVLHEAMAAGRKLRLVYATGYRGGAITERVVRPYRVLPVGRSWHLIAWCELRRAVLVFKLDRVREATLTDEAYELPGDFDADAWLGQAWGLVHQPGQAPEDVELLFEPFAGRWVSEERWHPSQQVEVLPNGNVRFRARVPVTGDLVLWVLGYGGRVAVVEPASLRLAVAAEASRALAVATGEAEPRAPTEA